MRWPLNYDNHKWNAIRSTAQKFKAGTTTFFILIFLKTARWPPSHETVQRSKRRNQFCLHLTRKKRRQHRCSSLKLNDDDRHVEKMSRQTGIHDAFSAKIILFSFFRRSEIELISERKGKNRMVRTKARRKRKVVWSRLTATTSLAVMPLNDHTHAWYGLDCLQL